MVPACLMTHSQAACERFGKQFSRVHIMNKCPGIPTMRRLQVLPDIELRPLVPNQRRLIGWFWVTPFGYGWLWFSPAVILFRQAKQRIIPGFFAGASGGLVIDIAEILYHG
jgi:hypothetical protein